MIRGMYGNMIDGSSRNGFVRPDLALVLKATVGGHLNQLLLLPDLSLRQKRNGVDIYPAGKILTGSRRSPPATEGKKTLI